LQLGVLSKEGRFFCVKTGLVPPDKNFKKTHFEIPV